MKIRVWKARPTEVRPAERRQVEVRPAKVRPAEIRPAEIRPGDMRSAEIRPAQSRPAEVRRAQSRSAQTCLVKLRSDTRMRLPPLVPRLDALLEDFEMFRVRHGRVTSLASALLRMISEGHTLCDRPRPVNAGCPTHSK